MKQGTVKTVRRPSHLILYHHLFHGHPNCHHHLQPFPNFFFDVNFLSIHFQIFSVISIHFQPPPAFSKNLQHFFWKFAAIYSYFKSSWAISSHFLVLIALYSPLQTFFIPFLIFPDISSHSQLFTAIFCNVLFFSSKFEPFPDVYSSFQPCPAFSSHSSNSQPLQAILTISIYFSPFLAILASSCNF